MKMSSRRLFQLITGFFTTPRGETPSVATKAPPPEAEPQSGALSMAAFFMRLRQEETLRARFVRDPRGVLREHGIDPPPFQLADRLDETEFKHLLATWTASALAAVNLARSATMTKSLPNSLTASRVRLPFSKAGLRC
ncbi:hypothetical protein MCBRY_000423 [Methylocystis bryophila]|uniref:Extradiol ring-cleavage dioxygenase LigAB LigA subunit domain-containing protein n=1 Tax=Methylocystis bryophila TaxID=655015 RepID=A0A1W6MSA9_9HYPH|nr:hypothetical protein B1812_04705 [Methylocystis bryophila]